MSNIEKVVPKKQIIYCIWSERLPEVLAPCLLAAQKAKYDLIDCAWRFGNEAGIGIAIKNSKTKITLPIQSKIWPTQFKSGVNKSLRTCLDKLGSLPSIHSYMLHRPHWDIKITINAWQQLVNCKNLGMVQRIGLGNFDKDFINLLISENLVTPDFVQFELSINNMRWDRITYFQAKNIEIQAYKPLGDLENNLKNPQIVKMAEKYKITVPQLLLAYLLHFNIIPVVSSMNPKHIAENIKARDVELDPKDVEKLKKINSYNNFYKESLDVDLDELNREQASQK